MRPIQIVFIAAAALVGSVAAQAGDHDRPEHHRHMAGTGGDPRQAVDFPPEMREHTLTNMRDHLLALSDILTAMAGARYAEAARIADARLGMASPSAEGCRDEARGGGPQMSKPAAMDRQMAEFMPEGMRQAGLEMHRAASAFAAEASKSGKTANAKPALAALSRVTERCAACHAAYRLQ